MIKTFKTPKEFEQYTEGKLTAGVVYYVESNQSVHFVTNVIDGKFKKYDFVSASQQNSKANKSSKDKGNKE